MSTLRHRSSGRSESGPTSVCSGCTARSLSVCDSLAPNDLVHLDAIAERLVIAPGRVITREDDAAVSVFNIKSGAVRVYKLLPDGRRQITAFMFAGDIIGPVAGVSYEFSAEAVQDATVCRFLAGDYRALARNRPALGAALLERAMHDLAVAQSRMVLLGRKTGPERIASFLVEMLNRHPLHSRTPPRCGRRWRAKRSLIISA